jgi:hypothetical protein
MKLLRIETNAIAVTWPYIKEYVEKPLKRNTGESTLEDVFNCLLRGQANLWVGVEDNEGIIGILITEFIFYPQYKALCLKYIGTKPHTIDKWLDYSWQPDSPILEYAKQNQVKRIEGCARDGWLKLIEKYNFKKYYTVVTKDLD